MPVLSENSENAVIRTFLYFSGFRRHNRQKAFNIKHFRRIRSIPKLPSKIAKQPLTHKTRNQFASNRTWVRIPSSPPKKSSKLKGLLDFPFLHSSLNLSIFPVRTACFLVKNRVQIRFCYLSLLGYIFPAAPEII